MMEIIVTAVAKELGKVAGNAAAELIRKAITENGTANNRYQSV